MSRNPRHPDAVDRHVAGRIRELRRLSGLLLKDLAAPLGVSYQQIYKYERGVNRPCAGHLFVLAETLGVSVEDFYEGLPGVEYVDPLLTDFVAAAGEMPLEQQKLLNQMMLRLIEAEAPPDAEAA